MDDLISDRNRFPFIKNRTVITVKIYQAKGVLIRFGSQISVVFATIFHETENRFPKKKEWIYCFWLLLSRFSFADLQGSVCPFREKTSTINDVSRLAGANKATVSRVLSGSRDVKEASRQAVLQAAEELHYRPDVVLTAWKATERGGSRLTTSSRRKRPVTNG
jgi:hypothetical protein